MLSKKNKLEKSPIFEQNHGLTPLEKCQFFDFFNFLFLCLEMRFLVQEYHETHFPGLYCLKKGGWKNDQFLKKTMEKCQFFDFFNFLFLLPRNAFPRSRILKNTFFWRILSEKKFGKITNF